MGTKTDTILELWLSDSGTRSPRLICKLEKKRGGGSTLSVKAQELLSDSSSLLLSDFKRWGDYGVWAWFFSRPRSQKAPWCAGETAGDLQGYTGYTVTQGWQNTTILEAG